MSHSDIKGEHYLIGGKALYEAYKPIGNAALDPEYDVLIPKWETLSEDTQQYFVAAYAALHSHLYFLENPEDYEGHPEFTPPEKNSEAIRF